MRVSGSNGPSPTASRWRLRQAWWGAIFVEEPERALHARLDGGQHSERAGDVEAANADRDTLLAEPGCDIEGAGELV